MTSLVRTKTNTFYNWAHTFHSVPADWYYPESVADVQRIVTQSRTQNRTIRVVGAGHSFTPLVATSDCLVSLDRLTGIVSLDDKNETVTVLAGTKLFDLSERLAVHGFSLENLGDINVQSVAGAIATGTHGTGITFGSISTQVESLTIVKADGSLSTLHRRTNEDAFYGAVVSLGMLGIIVSVTLRVVKRPIYHYESTKVQFADLQRELFQWVEEHQHFEFFLFPHSDTVHVKTMDPSDHGPEDITKHKTTSLVVENYLLQCVSSVCKTFPKSSKFFSRLSSIAVSETSLHAPSDELFSTPRNVRFVEMEYAVPLEKLPQILAHIRTALHTSNYHVHFPIEVRTVKADQLWLSPSYERPSAYIAFHMYSGTQYRPYFKAMEAIMDTFEGRPHWGKLHTKSTEQLSALYPRFQDFLHLREQFDPDQMFLNGYLRELIYR
ncbi:D-arabinono-1,4-lactone oxidase [Geomicrobium sediminis]|uniref:L-gulonolactone oxidase n=1 Tax=Geomicrobium sediminis TaxID=1347788 RepID=A0ABS2PCU0_9BACL|nr:D-arabinono-1,4-lactone oxidase [Geomicrobium sediminis]MBM7633260.1 L-gulonolactone oxidase [Geomicrobium sediminis]